MSTAQAKRLKELERENGQLRKIVADLTLDKLILQEAAKGNSEPLPPSGLRGRGVRGARGVGAAGVPGPGPAPGDPAASGPAPAGYGGPTAAIVALATQYGRYGYRRIAALYGRRGGP